MAEAPAAAPGASATTQVTLHQLLKTMVESGGTDLHITTNSPPQIRVHGKLVPLQLPAMTAAETKRLAYSVLTDAQKHRFEEDLELDFSFGVKGLARFRGNCFNQRGAVAAAYRTIPYEIKGFDALGVPDVIAKVSDKPRGLCLVTGPTGSGKSTTLAALIDKINLEKSVHIVTIEDPIEYLHPHKSCLVNQRELHADTKSFANALRAVLREDPDVVLIGEMRDQETIASALRIAETGHLTFGTLHTNSAAQTINRIIDVFPPNQQGQIRAQLSLILELICCQALLPKKVTGRCLCMGILVPNPAVRNLIREDKVHQIYSMMQTGQAKYGMQTFNQGLANLYFSDKITLETAMSRSSLPEELHEMIQRGAAGFLAQQQAQQQAAGPRPAAPRPPGPGGAGGGQPPPRPG